MYATNPKRIELIYARERLGLTRIEFAKKLGVSRSNVYRIEIGVSHPSLALMQRWLLALGPDAKMDWFRGEFAKARPSRRASSDAAA
jgi:transcriptional regulator with XRE-family HTH domain